MMSVSSAIAAAKEWALGLVGMICPEVCEVCGNALVKGERHICLFCLADMPRTVVADSARNPITMRFSRAGRIGRAVSMFVYDRSSPYAGLIVNAKYRGRPSIVAWLARKFAAELLATDFFDGIDVILPVPMFCVKKWIRGFNQAEEIAKGVSEATCIPVADNLTALRPHSTQTHRDAAGRLANTEGIYGVKNPEELAGKHVLIVDDVITTGATLEACISSIEESVSEVTVSILTLASTPRWHIL